MSRSKRKHKHSYKPAQKAESKKLELEKIQNFPTPVGRFEYDQHRYRFDVLVTGAVGTAVMVVGLLMMLLSVNVLGAPALLMVVVGGYTAFNTYIAKCYPRVVTLDDGSISFTSFGRTDTYHFSEIETFQVRDNRSTLNVYLRINGGGATSGRYFINCADMTDETGKHAQALYVYLLVMEARIDPDNIRTESRHLTDLIEDLSKSQVE